MKIEYFKKLMNRKFKIYLIGKKEQKFVLYKIGFYLKLPLNVKLISLREKSKIYL